MPGLKDYIVCPLERHLLNQRTILRDYAHVGRIQIVNATIVYLQNKVTWKICGNNRLNVRRAILDELRREVKMQRIRWGNLNILNAIMLRRR